MYVWPYGIIMNQESALDCVQTFRDIFTYGLHELQVLQETTLDCQTCMDIDIILALTYEITSVTYKEPGILDSQYRTWNCDALEIIFWPS